MGHDDGIAEFEVAGGSVPGRSHVQAGRNNQDAWGHAEVAGAHLLVVCDGCSNTPHAEVGAWIGCRIALEELSRFPSPVLFQERFLHRLRLVAELLGGPREKVVEEYLLFTLIAAVVTPEETSILALGDGLFVVNGELTRLGPFEGNRPPYVGYALQNPGLAITVQRRLPTRDIQSLLIATDGAGDLVDRLGEDALAGFWRDDLHFRNRDGVRRRLSMINRAHPAPLSDDTTLIALRRKEA